MPTLRSRDNPRVRRWAKLVRDARLRRREGRTLLEGPHLVAAALERGVALEALIASESGLRNAEASRLIARAGREPVVVPDALFRATVDAQSPQGIAAEIAIPAARPAWSGHGVFLEGIQDAGNVGAIIRSAAAFGAGAVVLDRACADPWSPKALRAGMGGHFALAILESPDLPGEIARFDGRRLCTMPRDGTRLREADLSGRLGWIFGGEGRGVSEALLRLAPARVTIPVTEGTESLNVAAAAAICLFEAFSRPGAGS